MIQTFDYAQTFYTDSNLFDKSDQVNITAIDLYFRRKPDSKNNSSGIAKPGVNIKICETKNSEPDLNNDFEQYARVEYDSITAYEDAKTAVRFSFNKPITLKSNRLYAFVVIFDDTDYELWKNTSGDLLVGQNTDVSTNSLYSNGKLFVQSNSSASDTKAVNDTDLKFGIYTARYKDTEIDAVFYNKDFDFVNIKSSTGKINGGERVAVVESGWTAVVGGSGINITKGSKSLNFSENTVLNIGDVVTIVKSDQSVFQVVRIDNKIDDKTYTTDKTIKLNNGVYDVTKSFSTATCYYIPVNYSFVVLTNVDGNFNRPNINIRGEDSGGTITINNVENIGIDAFSLISDIEVPSRSSIKVDINTTYEAGNDQIFSPDNKKELRGLNRDESLLHNGILVSHSSVNSVTPGSLVNDNLFQNKSVVSNVSLQINEEGYNSPKIKSSGISILTRMHNINNEVLDASGNDTEVFGNGKAFSRHISKQVTFSTGRNAEDLRMYMTAKIPAQTKINVYAKIKSVDDIEPFDQKLWSPLEYKTVDTSGEFSEYELGFPQYPESLVRISKTFQTTNNSNTITATSTWDASDDLSVGDLVKIYNPLIPSDYIVSSVSSVSSSTTFQIVDKIVNPNITGSGLYVDKLRYNATAYNYNYNDNIVRYFSRDGSGKTFDSFYSMQIKIVLLSPNKRVFPEIDQIQVIGVSA